MATHSSVLAWRIPWTEEPGGLQRVHGVTKSWTRLRRPNMHTIDIKCSGSFKVIITLSATCTQVKWYSAI